MLTREVSEIVTDIDGQRWPCRSSGYSYPPEAEKSALLGVGFVDALASALELRRAIATALGSSTFKWKVERASVLFFAATQCVRCDALTIGTLEAGRFEPCVDVPPDSPEGASAVVVVAETMQERRLATFFQPRASGSLTCLLLDPATLRFATPSVQWDSTLGPSSATDGDALTKLKRSDEDVVAAIGKAATYWHLEGHLKGIVAALERRDIPHAVLVEPQTPFIVPPNAERGEAELATLRSTTEHIVVLLNDAEIHLDSSNPTTAKVHTIRAT